jgi:hypothetical protein
VVEKPTPSSFHSTSPVTHSKMNDIINMDSTIDGVNESGYAYTNPLQQQDGTIRKQFT